MSRGTETTKKYFCIFFNPGGKSDGMYVCVSVVGLASYFTTLTIQLYRYSRKRKRRSQLAHIFMGEVHR